MADDFRERMLNKSNDELLEIFNKTKIYSIARRFIVQEILIERGVAIEKPIDESALHTKIKRMESFYYVPPPNVMPIIVGLIFIVSAFIPPYVLVMDRPTALFCNIFIFLVQRLVAIMWTHSLCITYGLKKGLWVTLVALFCGWALIGLNITIFAKYSKDETK